MLEGDLTDFRLADILRLVATTSKSGRLVVRREGGEGWIELIDGQVRDATAEVATLRFARRLLGSGLVDGDALVARVAPLPQLPSALELARALVADDGLGPAVLGELLREHVLDEMVELLEWSVGTFHLDGAAGCARGPSLLDVAVPVDEVLAEAERRRQARASSADGAQDLHAIPCLRTPHEQRTEVALPARAWSLLALIDGRRDVAELVRLWGQGTDRTRRTLGTLVDVGLVTTVEDAAAGPAARLVDVHARLEAHERGVVSGQTAPVLPVPDGGWPHRDLGIDLDVVDRLIAGVEAV